MRVTYEQECDLIAAVLRGVGALDQHAALQARWLAEADLRGRPSHGIQRVPMLVQRIEADVLDPAATARLTWRAPSALSVDGRDGFGPVIAEAVIEAALSQVGEVGVVIAAVSRSNHLGLLAPYVERIAAEGAIGLVMTTSEALVHAWGGARAMIGTNPIAIGVPTGDQPFILDMATGATSMGNVIAHARSERSLQAGWAVDASGAPTLDAHAALEGAISPFGAAKGYGLGLGLELLVATLSATALGTAVRGTLDCEHLSTKGDIIIVLDPDVFGGTVDHSAIGTYLADVRASAAPDSLVSIPGDRTRALRRRGLRNGFEVDADAWEDTVQLLESTAHDRSTKAIR